MFTKIEKNWKNEKYQLKTLIFREITGKTENSSTLVERIQFFREKQKIQIFWESNPQFRAVVNFSVFKQS